MMDNNSLKKSGILLVIGTPIGNLSDITYRAVEKLKEVDGIVAEDSRYSKRLIDEYGVDTPFTLSYYQGAGQERRDRIIDKLLKGMDLALISNAGTPLISDPGFKLVREAHKKGINVVGIPGPSAAITCLSISGQPTDSFVFFGQVPKKQSQKRKLFQDLRTETKTAVFYDSPHRVQSTFEVLSKVLPDRSITLCRELTKQYEENIKGSVTEVRNSLKSSRVQGEYTIVLCGATEEEIKNFKRQANKDIPAEQQLDGLQKLKGLPKKEALKELANVRGESKRELYDELNS